MDYVKNNSYCDLPFCSDTPYNDFYIYSNIRELGIKCEQHKEEIVKCRTVGILQSLNGRYNLTEISSNGYPDAEASVHVSMLYIKSPPPSTVIPYPVQVFGTLQWKNRPVIFAKLLQVLTVSAALRLKNALSTVTSSHLARCFEETPI